MFQKCSKNLWISLVALAAWNVPVFGIVCYKCNSITLEDCATSLNETGLPYEECTTSYQCTMSIVDSVTYRGCTSSTPIIGATYKKHCSVSLCNKGVYPPGRLKCYHCTGIDCLSEQEGKPRPCLNHHEWDECYTQLLSSSMANRGCRSDSNFTNSDSQVEFCDINGCNNKAAINRLICAQCDSIHDRGCKMDLPSTAAMKCNITQYTECELSVLLTEPETCFTYHNLNRVVRGCTRYIPEDIKEDVEHRHECHGTNLCNAACLQQQHCVVCDSNKNASCRDNASIIPNSVCGSAEVSSCFACEYNDWQVERGCGSPPLDSANINRCYECNSIAGCNAKLLTRCFKCSSEKNSNCANWERPGFDIDIEECEHPGATCIIAALPNGIIQRDCHGNDLECNDTLNSCLECTGSFCNSGPYPTNHLLCYQCVGDEHCEQVDIDPSPCPTMKIGTDHCFEYQDEEMGGIVKGCRSNAALYYRCILHNGGKDCRICYEDGCNRTAVKGLRRLRHATGLGEKFLLN